MMAAAIFVVVIVLITSIALAAAANAQVRLGELEARVDDIAATLPEGDTKDAPRLGPYRDSAHPDDEKPEKPAFKPVVIPFQEGYATEHHPCPMCGVKWRWMRGAADYCECPDAPRGHFHLVCGTNAEDAKYTGCGVKWIMLAKPLPGGIDETST